MHSNAERRNTGNKDFAARLTAARTDAGLSKRALAKILGKSSGAVSQWELAQVMPSPETMTDLAAAFGVSEAWLRYGEGTPAHSVKPARKPTRQSSLAEDIRRVERQLSEALAALQTLAARIEHRSE